MQILAINKEYFNSLKAKCPGISMLDLYGDIIYFDARVNPTLERVVAWARDNIFYDLFDNPKQVVEEEYIFIDESMYRKMFDWLEGVVKNTTLLDFVSNPDLLSEAELWVRVYRQFLDADVDFSEEVLIYRISL